MSTKKHRKTVIIGLFSAMSYLLMLIEIPLLPAYPFLRYDPSDIIPLAAGLYSGLAGSFAIIIIRSLCHLLLTPSQLPVFGELMSAIASLAFVIPSVVIYGHFHSRKGALLGLCASVLSLTLIMAAANFFLVPFFIAPMRDRSILLSYIAYGVLPFNLVKGALNALVTYLAYKRISRLMKGLR